MKIDQESIDDRSRSSMPGNDNNNNEKKSDRFHEESYLKRYLHQRPIRRSTPVDWQRGPPRPGLLSTLFRPPPLQKSRSHERQRPISDRRMILSNATAGVGQLEESHDFELCAEFPMVNSMSSPTLDHDDQSEMVCRSDVRSLTESMVRLGGDTVASAPIDDRINRNHSRFVDGCDLHMLPRNHHYNGVRALQTNVCVLMGPPNSNMEPNSNC